MQIEVLNTKVNINYVLHKIQVLNIILSWQYVGLKCFQFLKG